MSRPSASVAVCLGLAGLCASAIGGTWLARSAAPDSVLAHDFGQALADASLSWSTSSHNVWLSSNDGAGPVLSKALAVGDTITISGKGGRPDPIEVTALEHVDGDRFGMPGLRFQLVTGQTVAHPPGSSAQPTVRFLFALDNPEAVPAPRSADRVL